MEFFIVDIGHVPLLLPHTDERFTKHKIPMPSFQFPNSNSKIQKKKMPSFPHGPHHPTWQ